MPTVIRNSGNSGVTAYSLSIDIPTGVSSISVYRTVSGLGESELVGSVTSSDAIYSGDVLVASGTASVGYNTPSSITYTVVGSTVVTVTVGSAIAYKLYTSIPTGVASITVNRTSSLHGGSIGTITTSSSIYYGDTLTTSGTASSGYASPTGLSYTVTGNTTVTVTAGAKDLANISFADASWSDVKEIADAIRAGTLTVQTASSGYKYVNLSSYTWTVGDTKTLTINGTDYTARIVDFQHWTNANSGWSYGNTDAINMELVEVYVFYAHNSSIYWTGIWSGSNVYTYLTGTFFNLLPTDFSGNLINVKVKTSQGRTASTSIVTTNGKCNLPSIQELGLSNGEYESYEDCYIFNYYGVNNNASSRLKYYNLGSSSTRWWTRTPSGYVDGEDSSYRYWAYVVNGLVNCHMVNETWGVSPIFSY